MIGVVSDYYNDSVLQKYRQADPIAGFTLIKTEQLEIDIDSVWKRKSDQELQQVLADRGMFALTLALGYTRVAIYDGGWNEWQQRHPETARVPNHLPSALSPAFTL